MNVDDRIKVDGRLSKGEVLLDRYRIVRLIGEGGFADVYEASDLQEGRQVALKILHQVDGHKRQQTIRRRFILEAELVAQVKHPDVVELFDFGVTSDGRLFISLELLKGQTLEDALYRNGAMEPAHALRLVVRCLEALQSAHDLGIVHRDLKPSNLFVGRDADGVERLRILDFGIAFLTDEVSNRMTRTGQINGTPQYLAPEYIQQQVVTKALDVYQLALILVEMCTGVQVVSDDNPYKCLMAHVAGKLNLPEALMATSWGPVLRTALAADHEQRYADAAAFREALLPLLNGADAMHVYADDAVRRATGERRKERKLEHVLPVQIEVRNQDTPVALDRNAQLDDTHSQLIANPTPSRQGGNTKLIIVVVAVALVVAAATYLGVSHFIGQAGSPKTVSTLPPPPDASPDLARPVAPVAAESDEPEEIEFSADAVGVAVDVITQPSTAEILQGADTLGVGTATLIFDSRDDEPVELRIASTGYETKVAKVGPGDSPKRTIALKLHHKAPPRQKQKKKRKKKLKFFD